LTGRLDRLALRPEAEEEAEKQSPPKAAIKLADFHTVLDARKVDGSTSRFPVVSRREYLHNAAFTVAVGERPAAGLGLDRIAAALRRPRYTPVLGRRSCPISRPPLDPASPIEAADALQALGQVPPTGGPIYAEGGLVSDYPIQIRDVPTHGRHRQFGTRRVFVHKEDAS
jgi:CRISPR system Cascade subunit CasD